MALRVPSAFIASSTLGRNYFKNRFILLCLTLLAVIRMIRCDYIVTVLGYAVIVTEDLICVEVNQWGTPG